MIIVAHMLCTNIAEMNNLIRFQQVNLWFIAFGGGDDAAAPAAAVTVMAIFFVFSMSFTLYSVLCRLFSLFYSSVCALREYGMRLCAAPIVVLAI